MVEKKKWKISGGEQEIKAAINGNGSLTQIPYCMANKKSHRAIKSARDSLVAFITSLNTQL